MSEREKLVVRILLWISKLLLSGSKAEEDLVEEISTIRNSIMALRDGGKQ